MSIRSTLIPGLMASFTMIFALGCGGGANPLKTSNPRNTTGSGPAGISLSSSPGASIVAGDLGASGSYVILSKTGISTTAGSAVTGLLGVSPAAASYITGFGLVLDPTNVFSTSSLVSGRVYAADYAVPTPSNLTTAIGSIQTAYTDAAGRTPADFNELATGNLGGLTMTPGLYSWTTNVTIPTDVTLSGSATDIWIFQTTGNVTMSAAKNIILSGGALAKNVYWQVAGQVTIGTTASFKGIILCKTAIVLQTGASLSGRALSQTMVTLDSNSVIQPN